MAPHPRSFDSRYWGPLKRNYINGRPWIIYWSFKGSRAQYLAPGILNRLKGMAYSILNIFTKTRWKRTLKIVR